MSSNIGEVYEHKAKIQESKPVSDGFYAELEIPESFSSIILDINPFVDAVEMVRRDVEVKVGEEVKDILEVLDEDFEDNFDERDSRYRREEDYNDVFNLIENAREKGIDVYRPDSLCETVEIVSSNPGKEPWNTVSKMLENLVAFHLEESTDTFPYSQKLTEMRQPLFFPGSLNYDEDDIIREEAERRNGLIVTYDSDFIGENALTPWQADALLDYRFQE